jgi:2,4-dienoyl-CoA reductase-like NADH-dependent reductase (Old Yellow Enzyme family)
MKSPLVTPIDIKGRALKNRLGVAPMTRVTATEDGLATETMAHYYERFARGGFGLVISEGIYTDQAFSQGYVFQPGIGDDEQARSWSPVVAGIQAHGALAVAQIMHAGAISQGNRFRDTTVGPSAIQPKGKQMTFYYGKDTYAVPQPISDEQIAEAIAGFGTSAARAVGIAGFDAIEIHGAHGYLLDQFLTDYTNTRSDRWGGGVRERIGLTLAVLREVCEKVGAADDSKEFAMSKFAIGERVDNAADDHEGGTVIAVFPTVEGNFRYAVDMEGYGALQFFNEEKLVVHSC